MKINVPSDRRRSLSVPCSPSLLQVNPSIYETELKELRGLAWLLARHKTSLDSRDLNYLERQRKRHKTEVSITNQVFRMVCHDMHISICMGHTEADLWQCPHTANSR